MADKIYTQGLSIKEGKYSLRVGINVALFVKWLEENQNAKGFVNINVNQRKEVGKYGETHYATLDTWQPDNSQSKPEQQQGISYDNQNTTFEKDEELGF